MKLSIETENGVEEYEFETVASGVEAEAMAPVAPAGYYTIAPVDDEEGGDEIDAADGELGVEAAQFCDEYRVASINGIPEVKTVWERQCVGGGIFKTCFNVPVLYRRTSRKQFMVTVCVNSKPALTLAARCIRSAAVAGAVAAAFASPAAAVPVIKVELARCLIAHGEDAAARTLRVRARVVSGPGEWQRSS